MTDEMSHGEEALREALSRTLDRPIWTTRDGTEVAIADMTDRHLVNAAKMLLRNAAGLRNRAIDDLLAAGCFVSGEAATDAVNDMADNIMRSDPEDFVMSEWPDLFAEVERRGLEMEVF